MAGMHDAANRYGEAAARGRRVGGSLGIAVVSLAVLLPAAARADYYVYCANSRIEVDTRPPDQMRSARGSDLCQFGDFSTLSSARDLADKQFGGTGARCTCGR